MTRARLIQVWFSALVLIVVAAIAFGITVTIATALMLAALSLMPPAMVLLLWPGVEARSASDVLHDRNRGA